MRNYIIALVILLTAITQPARAEQVSTLTMAKDITLQLVEAINSKSYQQQREFVEKYIDADTLARVGGVNSYADYLAAESHFHGGFHFDSIAFVDEDATPLRADAYLTSENTQFAYRTELTFSEQLPMQITRLRFRAEPEQVAAKDKPTTDNAVNLLRQYLQHLSANEAFSGSVMVTKNNKAILKYSSGLASKRFDIKNNIETRFNLASMNKMFTAVTILKLVADGQLSLTDPMVKYLPLNTDDKQLKKIQIRHLLSHTSGIGSVNCEQGQNSIVESWQDCMQTLAKVTMNFSPGSQYRYSNDGMLVLGLIIEKLTHQTYYQAINTHVFAPAGMHNTECLDLQYPVKNAAIGYDYHGVAKQWRNNLFIHEKRGGPAGGCYSSAPDMMKFVEALLKHQLLDDEMLSQAFSAQVALGAENYGLGFTVRSVNGQKVVGHSGAFPGVSTHLDINLDSRFSIVILSNHSFAARPVLAKFQQLF
ncbi:hypothetical protein tinsulaeT_21020 [Thalassotalea insulae]|uniref:Beta-lactamase-related domain-containing protein n=1 Tax=Thalassotalea insulae TaxID=2056778 RepID=A0ABQ6GS77_9GAMM|nr:serine hydrolase domain-containing protein [Thalassotalea insulae]GLX78762.1 hypothetical protein tinsulaeT_21020 [Thalassotalea insulae]